MKTLLRNGTVATASAVHRADVLVEEGVIAAVGLDLDAAGAEVVDAGGCYVMPGGIDVHTHLDNTSFGVTTADDFATGTVAAACGGTTAIVDFCQQGVGTSLKDSLAVWHGKAGGKSVIDYGFHIIINDPSDAVIDEIPELPGQGVTSVKLFMAYRGVPGMTQIDDLTMLRIMEKTRASGQVVMVHAENGDAADMLRDMCAARGDLSPKFHAVSRPPRTESEATARAIAHAELMGAPLYVVHLTCEDALDELIRGRRRGAPVFAETCTQYLYCTTDDLDRPDFEGAKYVFTPPVRSARDNEVLWNALSMGLLKAVSSDHSPWNFVGQKDLGRDDFRKIPNGAPGIEERMTMVWQGVNQGRFGIDRFVDIVSTNPARLFGLYPQKGTIAAGSDADIVIWDPEAEMMMTKPALHSAVDYTLFEGMPVKGLPRTVFLRGEMIVDGREYIGSAPGGRFLKRAAFDPGAV